MHLFLFLVGSLGAFCYLIVGHFSFSEKRFGDACFSLILAGVRLCAYQNCDLDKCAEIAMEGGEVKESKCDQAGWSTPIIPLLKRLRQEGCCKLETSLCYKVS